MAAKQKYTREEFAIMLKDMGRKMAGDRDLHEKAKTVLIKADQYNWIHQTSWMGEPILNLATDMFAIQEIIWKTRPKYIIELGVAWGGAMLFYSSLMGLLGGEKVIGVDINIPEDLTQRLRSHGAISDRIVLINGSSVDPDTVKQVGAIVGSCRDVLVLLDSFHTHDHVLQELRLYSPLVGKGCYLVCGDTIVEDLPEQTHRPRPWGHGNNPKTAVRQFLGENQQFEVDEEIENKLLFTCNPIGYLRRRAE